MSPFRRRFQRRPPTRTAALTRVMSCGSVARACNSSAACFGASGPTTTSRSEKRSSPVFRITSPSASISAKFPLCCHRARGWRSTTLSSTVSGSIRSTLADLTHASASIRFFAACRSKARIGAPRARRTAARSSFCVVSLRPTTRISLTLKPRLVDAAISVHRAFSMAPGIQSDCHSRQPPPPASTASSIIRATRRYRCRQKGTTRRRGCPRFEVLAFPVILMSRTPRCRPSRPPVP